MVEFKTSFIPKKPIVALAQERRPSLPTNLLSTGSLIVLLFLLVVAGGLYFYKVALKQSIETMSDSLDRARDAIDPVFVGNLKRLDGRLQVARVLLENHMLISPIFGLLEDVSLKSVQLDQFSFSLGEKGEPEITLSGKARDYSSLALQSDAFGGSSNIQESLFSNLRLDTQGRVLFSFTGGINKSLLRWKGEESAPSQASPQTPPEVLPQINPL